MPPAGRVVLLLSVQCEINEGSYCLLDMTFKPLRCAVLPQEAKKRYDKETEKYCSVLEKHLSLSARRKEAQLQEVENRDHILMPSHCHLSHLTPPTPTLLPIRLTPR